MTGDAVPGVPCLQCWINNVGIYDCNGRLLDAAVLGTNMSIRWSGDLTTQITDGANFLLQKATGAICDPSQSRFLLKPQGTLANNGTKGNPCLVADLFGDFRNRG
ncbi:MAG: hypothetical protein LBT59_29385 [Clostridiales bacterium]|jgi:hypothetical protein|nr:hypothetical protein [Clostridiales bacterium]